MRAHIFFDREEEPVDRISLLLLGIPGGVQRAVGSAVKRTAQHTLDVGMRMAAQEYAISQRELKSRTRNINRVNKTPDGGYQVTFGYRGNVIPLIKFDVRLDKKGRVYARVLRSSTRKQIKNAFVLQKNGHARLYRRLGPESKPIEKLFGPTPIQVFYRNEATEDAMYQEARRVFDQKLDHEVMRLLNGWGG